MKRYEDRVVAYIDVLGFKNQIKSTIYENEENDQETQRIYEAYSIIRSIWNLDSNDSIIKKTLKSKKVSIFSDSIVVSFKVTDQSGLFFMLLELMWLIMQLVSKKIFCRGAICYGKLYHTNKMIFGPALIEAYNTESKAALYPRIVLDESVIRICAKYGMNKFSDEKKSIQELLAKDTDGMYYIEYFSKVQSEFDNTIYDYVNYLKILRDIIVENITHDTPIDIRIKYLWMADKYNLVVNNIKNNNPIDELGEDGENELDDVFAYLSPIRIPDH